MKLTAETFKDYAHRLEKSGIKMLGEGAFGKVYQHPTYNNVAVKIVRKDPANAKWLRFCVAHKGNPYLPKLYGVQALDIDDSKKAYVVFMEKLKPCPVGAYWALYTHVIPGANPGNSHYALKLNINNPYVWAMFAKVAAEPNLKALALLFAKCRLGSLDLSQSNLMLRGEQIVFVDPLA